MAYRNRTTVFSSLSLFPDKLCYKVLLTKNIVTEQLQICLFIVINRDKDNAVLAQQVTGQLQAGRHKHQPGRMGAAASRGEVKDTLCLVLFNAQFLL